MTREEILALPAGRELDALIAEKVMGWKPNELCTDMRGVPFWQPYPGYSTDIAAAWQVVEKLLEVLPLEDFHLEHMVHEGWAVGTCFREDWITGETAPLAICRAALCCLATDLDSGR